MSILQAILLAIVEGLTEFLPVSSTGHLIITSSVMGIASDPFTKMFTVAIQLGAILAVAVLYVKRFFQTFTFYFKLLVAFIPAAVIGLVFHDYIDAFLESVVTVAIMLIIGGIVFLFIDRLFSTTEEDGREDISYRTAIRIGFFQVIALLPGVSRSAATIIGGLTQKLTKKAAAEFSFFLAVPTMTAATGYKLYEFYKGDHPFGSHEIVLLLVGNAIAFLVAMFAIRSFLAFLTRNGFLIFGYYRIVLGVALLIMYFLGGDLSIV